MAPRSPAASAGHTTRAPSDASLPAISPGRLPATPAPRHSWRLVLLVWGAWLALVCLITGFHEYWRDEVRAASIATTLPSYRAVLSELHIEGHPAVWYILLRTAWHVSGTPHVLAATSIVVAGIAVLLVLRRGPFAWPTTALIAFGGFAAYEYVVMARNYGISMLALFAWAAAYPHRWRVPWLVGLVLLCLANTNVHSAAIGGAILVGWMVELWREAPSELTPAARRRVLVGIGLGAVGIVICGYTLWPPNVVPVAVLGSGQPHLSSVRVLAKLLLVPLGLSDMFGFRTYLFGILGSNAPGSPETLVPLVVANATVGLLVVLLAGWLLRRARYGLAATWVVATFGLKLLFAAVYPGMPRHQGLLFMLAIALVWAVLATQGAEPRGEGRWLRSTRFVDPAFRGIFAFALVASVLAGVRDMWRDVRYERSSIAAFGRWLRARPEYRDAAIIADPAYVLEALPYYAPNAIFLPRERVYRRWVRFDRTFLGELTLADLLQVADSVARADHRQILLALPTNLADSAPGRIEIGPGSTFSWDVSQLAALHRSARLAAAFTNASLENFLVFALAAPSVTR